MINNIHIEHNRFNIGSISWQNKEFHANPIQSKKLDSISVVLKFIANEIDEGS